MDVSPCSDVEKGMSLENRQTGIVAPKYSSEHQSNRFCKNSIGRIDPPLQYRCLGTRYKPSHTHMGLQVGFVS